MNRRKFLAFTGTALSAALTPTLALPALEIPRAVPIAPARLAQRPHNRPLARLVQRALARPDVLDRLLELGKYLDRHNVPDLGRVLYLSLRDLEELDEYMRVWGAKAVPFPFNKRGYVGTVERFSVYCDTDVPERVMYAMHDPTRRFIKADYRNPVRGTIIDYGRRAW